ncbi:DUF1405 domain-containing protein [Halopenitus persicus]|uniref:Uncharacterized membrane protein YpjA n=1 Tax=Halopenitus persicus TaxID=1048396 RepID=A0A1H3HFG4_9EURY|nr:DUF1405 domain-containing protein [Halopenitus persicus]SDY13578.1 Uncharacterized membrane protein YpjA [Halopenitus persicus]
MSRSDRIPVVALRDPTVRRRIRDRAAEEFLGDASSLLATLGICAVGVLVGGRFYVATMPAVPTLLWPLYADSPTALALVMLALAALLPTVGSGRAARETPTNRPLAYLQTLAFVWLVKYGLWPLVALNRHADLYLGSPDALASYWGILVTHLLFVALALLLPAIGRTTRGALGLALGLSLCNDVLDYGFGFHPPLRYDPGVVLPVVTVAIGVGAVVLANRSFRRLGE